MRRASRVIWELTHGPIAAGLCVLHRCDNRACVNPAHLFLGTHAANMADMTQKGRQAKGSKVARHGEQHGCSKLTTDTVEQILRSTGTQKSIAKRFGISRSHVSAIKLGKFWKHISRKTSC
ncbi:HNH endonuclease signature motif containing protein [Caulifigura coniformis]